MRAHIDGNDIKAGRRIKCSMFFQVVQCNPGEPGLFFPVHGFLGPAVPAGVFAFHLNKYKLPSIPCYYIYFTEGAPEISFDYYVVVVQEVTGGKVLA